MSDTPEKRQEPPFIVHLRRAIEAVTTGMPRAQADAIIRRAYPAFAAVYSRAVKRQTYDQCTPASVAACVALCASIGLWPDGGALAPAYLVPQAPRRDAAPELHVRVNHRGITILALRGGIMIQAIPVAATDEYEVSLGELISHYPTDASMEPQTIDELAGVGVSIRSGALRQVVWVPRSVILQSRGCSRDYGYAVRDGKSSGTPWMDWPIAMAQGAAIRSAARRGAIPIDSAEVLRAVGQALDLMDGDTDPAPLALPDHGQIDEMTGSGDERERVTVDPPPQQQTQRPRRAPPGAGDKRPPPAPAREHTPSHADDGDDGMS